LQLCPFSSRSQSIIFPLKRKIFFHYSLTIPEPLVFIALYAYYTKATLCSPAYSPPDTLRPSVPDTFVET